MAQIVQVDPLAKAALVATIAAGASLSDAIDLGGVDFIGIEMPAGWDAANLTFQVAESAKGTYQDLYDDGGNEVTVVAAAARCIVFFTTAALALRPFRFLKLRSGTSGIPVAQSAARTLNLLRRQGA